MQPFADNSTDDSAGEQGTVMVAPGAAADVADALADAGWTEATRDPQVIVADARAGLDPVATMDGITIATRSALLALVADTPDAAEHAYDAGATHVATGLADLPRALRFAGRYARRLRGQGRRIGEHADGLSAALVSEDDPDGVAVLIAALTSFEIVNAAFGREAGDALLRAAEARIADALADAASALSGEGATFTIAVSGSPAAGDAAVVKLERALAQPFQVAGETIHVGARIGMARRVTGEPVEHLLRRAAEALARARGSDGATTQIAAETGGVALAALAADLHRAIERDEIDVVFQPQVVLASGAITGVEALARWRHHRLGWLGAATLFAAAERADLGIALSDHVQALALSRAAAWPTSLSHLRVAVNVTAADIARADFAPQFLDRVDASGLPCERVTAEVTESGLVRDLDAATASLDTLRAAGCRVAIDDFGTGYSSLAYLTQLPLDYLKIDRQLTQAIVGDERQRVVVEGIIAIAAALGMETIAEGVETEEQRALLAERGCTWYQGFLCAGPLDDGELVALIERES
jgi:EAL domain-containing protein (putative c-di-GMP-specific phosphodiesterase class I)/GGDEF domain-containing protein